MNGTGLPACIRDFLHNISFNSHLDDMLWGNWTSGILPFPLDLERRGGEKRRTNPDSSFGPGCHLSAYVWKSKAHRGEPDTGGLEVLTPHGPQASQGLSSSSQELPPPTPPPPHPGPVPLWPLLCLVAFDGLHHSWIGLGAECAG